MDGSVVVLALDYKLDKTLNNIVGQISRNLLNKFTRIA